MSNASFVLTTEYGTGTPGVESIIYTGPGGNYTRETDAVAHVDYNDSTRGELVRVIVCEEVNGELVEGSTTSISNIITNSRFKDGIYKIKPMLDVTGCYKYNPSNVNGTSVANEAYMRCYFVLRVSTSGNTTTTLLEVYKPSGGTPLSNTALTVSFYRYGRYVVFENAVEENGETIKPSYTNTFYHESNFPSTPTEVVTLDTNQVVIQTDPNSSLRTRYVYDVGGNTPDAPTPIIEIMPFGTGQYNTTYNGDYSAGESYPEWFHLRVRSNVIPYVFWDSGGTSTGVAMSRVITAPVDATDNTTYYEYNVLTQLGATNTPYEKAHCCRVCANSQIGVNDIVDTVYFIPITESGGSFYSGTYDGTAHARVTLPTNVYPLSSTAYNWTPENNGYIYDNDENGWVLLSNVYNIKNSGSYRTRIECNGIITGQGDFTGMPIMVYGQAYCTIDKLTLQISTVTVYPKEYDGTDNVDEADIDMESVTYNNLISGDDVTAKPLGTYDSIYPGSNIPVSVAFSLEGDDIANYNPPTTQTLTSSITKRLLRVTMANTQISDKTYDGSATTTVNVLDFYNYVNDDNDYLSVTATGTFITSASQQTANPNAGNNKPVKVVYTMGAGTKGNRTAYYSRPSTRTNMTANIFCKPVNVNNTIVDYNNGVQSITPGTIPSSSIVGSDVVTPSVSSYTESVANSVATIHIVYSSSNSNYCINDDYIQIPITVTFSPVIRVNGTALVNNTYEGVYNGMPYTLSVYNNDEQLSTDDYDFTWRRNNIPIGFFSQFVQTSVLETSNIRCDLEEIDSGDEYTTPIISFTINQRPISIYNVYVENL